MSRRASLAKKEAAEPAAKTVKKGVRFPSDLVFLENIKENDIVEAAKMLRRASLKIDLNAINNVGLTPLHQAVLDDNLQAVELLIQNGANVNQRDEDTWTPLHAACADGHAEIARYLLAHGADASLLTDDGERPVDLAEPTDHETIAVFLQSLGRTESQFEDDEDDDER